MTSNKRIVFSKMTYWYLWFVHAFGLKKPHSFYFTYLLVLEENFKTSFVFGYGLCLLEFSKSRIFAWTQDPHDLLDFCIHSTRQHFIKKADIRLYDLYLHLSDHHLKGKTPSTVLKYLEFSLNFSITSRKKSQSLNYHIASLLNTYWLYTRSLSWQENSFCIRLRVYQWNWYTTNLFLAHSIPLFQSQHKTTPTLAIVMNHDLSTLLTYTPYSDINNYHVFIVRSITEKFDLWFSTVQHLSPPFNTNFIRTTQLILQRN